VRPRVQGRGHERCAHVGAVGEGAGRVDRPQAKPIQYVYILATSRVQQVQSCSGAYNCIMGHSPEAPQPTSCTWKRRGCGHGGCGGRQGAPPWPPRGARRGPRSRGLTPAGCAATWGGSRVRLGGGEKGTGRRAGGMGGGPWGRARPVAGEGLPPSDHSQQQVHVHAGRCPAIPITPAGRQSAGRLAWRDSTARMEPAATLPRRSSAAEGMLCRSRGDVGGDPALACLGL
jgi:hypothetical protein